jgi:hypothetical protein
VSSLASSSPVPQAGGTTQVCAPLAHRWLSSGQYLGWLVCAVCGTPAVCKACAALDGTPHPGCLPDVFCARHQRDAARYSTLPVSSGELVGRILHLSGSLPRDAWQRDDSSPSWGPVSRAFVEIAGLRLAVLSAMTRNFWRVLVYAVPFGESPVLSAEGPSTACQVSSLTPGPWVERLRALVTLRGARLVQPGETRAHG